MVRSGANFMDDYLERLAQPSAMQLARMGDFRAIAYWLNASLVPHGIYARVAEDRPGTLLVLLEFFRLPRRDRLNHLVCHRLCRLHSPLIQGVRILARFANQTEILWDTSIRLVFVGQPRVAAAAPPRRRRPPRSRKRLKAAIAPVAALPAAASTPPSLPAPRRRVRRRKPVTPAHTAPQPMMSGRSAVRRSPRRRPASRRSNFPLTPSQFKLISGSAAALFLLGFGVQLWQQASSDVAQVEPRQEDYSSIRTALGRIPVIDGGSDATNPTVTLTFTGGSTLHAASAPISDAQNAGDEPTEPFAVPLQERPLPRADVTLVNLPEPLAASGEDRAASSQRVQAAQNARVSLVNLSAPPASESDAAALQDTLEMLQQSGMHPVGAGLNAREARMPDIVEVRGKRIAYLGYADGRSPQNSGDSADVSALEEQVAEDIRAIRDKVDWVVVNYHWTEDIASYPEPWQMSLARSAIDQGADLVVGYHPNVLQGAEIYRGRAIAYSLGNFIFEDQVPSDRSDYDSAVLKVSLNNDQMRLEFLPVEVQGQQAAIATGKRAEEIRTYLTQASALFEKPLQTPIILDRQATGATPSTQPENPDVSEPTAPTAQPTDADSFITYPEGDPSGTPTPKADPEQPFTTPSFTAPGGSTEPDKAQPKPGSPEAGRGWEPRQPTASPASGLDGFTSEPAEAMPSEMDEITKPQSSSPEFDRSDTEKADGFASDSVPSPQSVESGAARWLPDRENTDESGTVPEEVDQPVDAAL